MGVIIDLNKDASKSIAEKLDELIAQSTIQHEELQSTLKLLIKEMQRTNLALSIMLNINLGDE